jgi:hypothetical protein
MKLPCKAWAIKDPEGNIKVRYIDVPEDKLPLSIPIPKEMMKHGWESVRVEIREVPGAEQK